jgi:ectoine hydroxylase-related dioxygenase (phytanoyl-CoA dioxygenase family)
MLALHLKPSVCWYTFGLLVGPTALFVCDVSVAETRVTAAILIVTGICFAVGRHCSSRQDSLMELAQGIHGQPPVELQARSKRIEAKKALARVPLTQDEELSMLDVTETERFALDNPAWLDHLNREGFVVVAEVADPGNIAHAEKLLWEFIERQTTWKRNDPETWTDAALEKIGSVHNGLVNGAGMGQSDFLWYLRTLPRVRKAFGEIWKTDALLVSFDCAGLFRPWNHGFRKTIGGWWHVDQGRAKQGRHAVQGLISLYDANSRTGGLTVVPQSHHRFDEVVEDQQNPNQDYCTVQPYCSVLQELQRKLVSCKAGDLILWDSRTVHANAPAPQTPVCDANRLLRAVAYICMTPKSFASQEVLKTRRMAYEYRVSTSHWPHKDPLDLGSQSDDDPRSLNDAIPEVSDLVA